MFAGAVLVGITELFALLPLMVLWYAQCDSHSKDDVYYAQMLARKSNARDVAQKPRIRDLLSAAEWFRYFSGIVPSMLIVAIISTAYSFVLLADPFIPLYYHFAVCGTLVYIVLSEMMYFLYLVGAGLCRNYINLNFFSNLLHVLVTAWVVVAFFVGGATLTPTS